MYMYIGKPLLTFFENEKPALKQQIEQECEKVYIHKTHLYFVAHYNNYEYLYLIKY